MLKFYTPDNIPRASKRLRAEIPAKYFGSLTNNLSQLSSEDVVVFSKKSTIPEIKFVVDNKIKFIFDICDDQFDDPFYKEMFSYACKHASLITVPTDRMKSLVEERTNKKVIVITDPYERERKEPSFSPKEKLKILFFGCRDNFIPVPWINLIEQLEKRGVDFQIDAIFNLQQQDFIKFKNERLNLHEWTYEKQTDLLLKCDLVLLPFLNNFKNISTKSPNRIVESLNVGKFVISNYGVDSYNEFGDFIFLDTYDRIADGIAWAIANQKDILNKISEGQKFIDKNYSPKNISEVWKYSYHLVKDHTMTNKLVEIIEKYDLNGFRPRYDNQGRHLGGWGTDKNDWHSFCGYYEEALLPYVDQEVNVLELGTNYGGSAILWYEYLPKSNLLLLDIEETINPKIWDIFEHDRFVYANCDAYTKESAEEVRNIFSGGIDLLFEDGPHTIQSQLKTLELYLDQVNDGGIVFIEDVQKVEHFDELQNKLDEITKDDELFRYETERVDLRNVKDRYDDLIFVVRKFAK